MRSVILILVSVLCNTWNVSAQYPLMKHYSISEGLMTSNIHSMLQDNEGFLWFATGEGVMRFDGKTFQKFTIADGLSNISIAVIKKDKKNRIWFMGGDGSVSYWLNGIIFNEKSDTLLRHIKDKFFFTDLFEDKDGKLWFTSFSDFLIIDGNKIFRSKDKMNARASFIFNGNAGQIVVAPYYYPYCMRFTSTDTIPIKLTFGVYAFGYSRFDDMSVLFIAEEGIVFQKDSIQKLLIKTDKTFNAIKPLSMTLSADSMVWIATSGDGIFRYDLKNPNDSPVIFLRNKRINGVLEDREMNIWISVKDDGLYMIPASAKKVTVRDIKNGLSDNQCPVIHTLFNGDILIGQSKGQLKILSGAQTSDYKIPNECFNNLSNELYQIVSRGDDVWIGTQCGLIHKNAKTKCNHWISYKDSAGGRRMTTAQIYDIKLGGDKVYFLNNTKALEYPVKCPGRNSDYPAKTIQKFDAWVFGICIDHSNRIWFGTNTGLRSINANKLISHFEEDPLLGKKINAIAETDDSVLIIATNGYGILFYKDGKIIQRVTKANGLSNDLCSRVSVYKNRIFVSTSSGVSILEYIKGKVVSIKYLNNGNFLPSNAVNDVFVDEHQIYVATMEGATILRMSELDYSESVVPDLNIMGIKVNDVDYNLAGDHSFRYDENSFKINFIGINFQNPGEVTYRYRLKDDQAWRITENNVLEFSFLEPGKYFFQLQARVKDGAWSKSKIFHFAIIPPFWLTLWFKTLILFAISSAIYIIVKLRSNKKKRQLDEKAKIEKQIAQLEQQALQTMMNPHFIFNVMNSIQHFINSNNKEAANYYLTDFATLIRMNLTILHKRFIPLEEEIEYLKLYLSFEKLRFGERLTYEIIVDHEIDPEETTIAVMMIQPFIENAIWHGILPLKSNGHIVVEILKAGEDLIKVSVKDNGIGIAEKFIVDNFQDFINESHALSLTLQRLTLLGKTTSHQLYMKYNHLQPEMENKGTVAELLLPSMLN